MNRPDPSRQDLTAQIEALRRDNAALERRQARYARREALHDALRLLHEEIWRMRGAGDIHKVLGVLQQALTDLGIDYWYCSVNVVDDQQNPPTVSAFNIEQTGAPKFIAINEASARTVVRFWRGGEPVYRGDLDRDDPYGEKQALDQARSVLDVPFSHGTLALSNKRPGAFSRDDIVVLQGLADAISSIYSRYLDFRKMEEQNHRLVVAGLVGKVREVVLAMTAEEDFASVVEVMMEELAAISPDFGLGVAHIVDGETGVCRHYGATADGWSGQIEQPLSQIADDLLDAYRTAGPAVRPSDEALTRRYQQTCQLLGAADRATPAAFADAPFAYGTLSLAIDRAGDATEYAALAAELARVVGFGFIRLQDIRRLETQAVLNRALSAQNAVGEFTSVSEDMARLEAQIDQVAATDLTVLVLGETGTGKGVVARAIHAHSPRRDGPFVQVNCGAIAEGLVESELFGHEKGAFTGATARQLGKVELAEEGTLFLDEIGDMPLGAQVKLLQLLQERTFERVGGSQALQVTTRIIAATNRDLPQLVGSGRFREDLYFRLNTFPVQLPPLRQRRDDIPLLARHFAAAFAQHLNRPAPRIDAQALARLQDYAWPGNVRELEHLMQRAVLVCQDGHIDIRDVAGGLDERQQMREDTDILPLAEYEKRYIERVLARTKGVVSGKKGAAQLLAMHPETLRARMRKHGLR